MAVHPITYERRFFSRVKIYRHTECWLWTGTKSPQGYGLFQFHGKATTAHRVAHILMLGPIPEGLHVDHLCRNRACVNPEHLEAVTAAENTRRAREAQQWAPFCFRGHPLNESTTYRAGGQICCIACREIRQQQKRAKQCAA